MEPYDSEELTDRELDGLLREWKAPAAPTHLRAAVFPARGAWLIGVLRRIWTGSVRVPVPVAVCLAVLLGIGGWLMTRPGSPRVIVKTEVRTERVEVPVVTEREVPRIVYRDRAPVARPITFNNLQPVAELRPRIIRSGDAHN
jgi:hypothetical protein